MLVMSVSDIIALLDLVCDKLKLLTEGLLIIQHQEEKLPNVCQ